MFKALSTYAFVIIIVVLLFPVITYRYLKYVKLEKPRNYQKIYKLNNFVFKYVLKISNVKYQVSGIENLKDLESGFLVVGNHQSYFDIPILSLIFSDYNGLSFVSKDGMKKLYLFSIYMEVMNCIFLDRNSAKSGIKMIKKGNELLISGVNLVVFPEGSRSENGEVKDFKAGALKIATRVNKPIVPISISYSGQIMESNFKFKSKVVEVVINPAVTSNDYQGITPQGLNEEIRNSVVSKVKI